MEKQCARRKPRQRKRSLDAWGWDGKIKASQSWTPSLVWCDWFSRSEFKRSEPPNQVERQKRGCGLDNRVEKPVGFLKWNFAGTLVGCANYCGFAYCARLVAAECGASLSESGLNLSAAVVGGANSVRMFRLINNKKKNHQIPLVFELWCATSSTTFG